ncbi:hypothetical protein J6590_018658 [Homalodisca vitripennis]|nr:hypothetical protein J6590_018658 [Homalodisca vitripennis]
MKDYCYLPSRVEGRPRRRKKCKGKEDRDMREPHLAWRRPPTSGTTGMARAERGMEPYHYYY